nr:hypothetical protein [Tanacetum cinerariifolium]
MKLDREMKKEEEEAIIKVKGEALIEKEDPRAFVIPIRLEARINLNALADTSSDINVMPYRVYKELGRDELKNVNRGITMLIHSKAEPTGLLKDVLLQTSLNTEETDNDDEKDYGIQRNNFGAPMYGPKPAKYLNCHDPLDRSIALQEVLNPFSNFCVWKKAVSFLGSLLVALQHEDWKPRYTRNYYKKEEEDG